MNNALSRYGAYSALLGVFFLYFTAASLKADPPEDPDIAGLVDALSASAPKELGNKPPQEQKALRDAASASLIRYFENHGDSAPEIPLEGIPLSVQMTTAALFESLHSGKIEPSRQIARFILRNSQSLVIDIDGDIYPDSILADASLTLWLCSNYPEYADVLKLPWQSESYKDVVPKDKKEASLLSFMSLYFSDSANISAEQYFALMRYLDTSKDEVLKRFLERRAVYYIGALAVRDPKDPKEKMSRLLAFELYCDLLRLPFSTEPDAAATYLQAADFFDSIGDHGRQRKALLKGLEHEYLDFYEPLAEADGKRENSLSFLRDLIDVSLGNGSLDKLGSHLPVSSKK